MVVSHFLQHRHELLWRYFDRLNNFFVQYGQCIGKSENLSVIYVGVNVMTQTILKYFGFLSKTVDEALDLLKWVTRDTYEFKKIIHASWMSFFDPCAFHTRSVYEENFVSFCSLPIFIPNVPLLCATCAMLSDSWLQYILLKAEIENNIEIAFNSMEHMMSEMFNQFLELGQKQNDCNF